MTAARPHLAGILALALLAAPLLVWAQQPRIYRVGVIHQGGSYNAALDGLRDGLKELGLEEGKQYVFHLRDAQGDLAAVEALARSLEAEKVDLVCTFATSTTLKTKDATKSVPIVFYVGTDPVKLGLVESFRKPGGRLTGIFSQVTDLTGKRLELLKEMVPRLRRAAVFYNPDNPSARESLTDARKAAHQLKVGLVERPTHSAEELRAAVRALRAGEVDAILHISDATITSHADLIIETAKAKKLPFIFQDRESVIRGALASYGISYYAGGRLLAKYVQRGLQGADPGDLPIEQIDRLILVINVKTARAIGLTIPSSVLRRADEIIE